MNLKRIKSHLLCGLILISGGAAPLSAQEVVSGIFGFNKLTLVGGSDTFVSLPFSRLPESSVLVSSTSSSNIIQVQGTPGWTNNQFVYVAGVQSNNYYVRIESGALEGRYFNITSNTTNTLTVDLNGGSLTGLATNDQVVVVPHWTLASVFGPDGNGIVISTSTTLRKTEVLVPSFNGSGINLSAATTYFLYTNAGSVNWRRTGASTNCNDDIIRPNGYILIRHKAGPNTTFVSYGDVILTKVNIPLVVNSTNKQDNFVSMPRPLDLSLNDSGLIASGAFVPSTSTTLRKDELLIFDNSATNVNKSAASTFYYFTGSSSWRKVGLTNDYGSSNIFQPGAGFIIRKAASAVLPVWTNSPTYTNN
jgi:uncharacterized protein (TIGR02597 family)